MADCKRKTANLFDGTLIGGYFTAATFTTSGDEDVFKSIKVYLSAGTYTFSWGRNVNVVRLIIDGKYSVAGGTNISSYTITSTTDGYVGISFRDTTSGTTAWDNTTPIMLNTGSTALPYEPYGWLHSLRKLTTATEAVENPLYADGTAITAYTIKGNTVQSGTPTPSNPVEVQGVGNKTANLSSINEVNDTITNSYFKNNKLTIIPVTAGTYTISFYLAEKTSGILNGSIGIGTSTDYAYDIDNYPTPDNIPYTITRTFTITQSQIDSYGGYIWARFLRYNTRTDFSYKVTQIMLNTGSTALPYEPYGYKIPILINQQTIDIYIGDLPLLKSLDGTAVDEISNGTLTRRVDSDGSVLPTPTTTQITMPSILTTEGANSITVDTTVQPSEFTATWTGWHDSSVKEYDGTDWQ